MAYFAPRVDRTVNDGPLRFHIKKFCCIWELPYKFSVIASTTPTPRTSFKKIILTAINIVWQQAVPGVHEYESSLDFEYDEFLKKMKTCSY